MSNEKNIFDNFKDELFDVPLNSKSNNKIEFLDDIYNNEPEETEKDYIVRNKKKYYKTDRPYIYKCEDGYYAYRIVHKPSKTNSFVNRHKDTKERFNTEYKAFQGLQEHIKRLDKDETYKSRNITFGEVWEHIKNTVVKEESTITKYDSIYRHHVSFEFGETPIQDVSYSDVNNYLELMYKLGDCKGKCLNGYSYTFTESILKYFWLVFQNAFSMKVISAEQLRLFKEEVKMPKKLENEDIRILSIEEMQKVYNLLKDTDYLLAYLISVYTGARPAETFAVRFSDFDLINNKLSINKQIVEFQGMLTFKEPKTFSRVVDIPEVLKQEVVKRYALIENAKKQNPNLFEVNRKKVEYRFKKQKCIDYIYDDMVMTNLNGVYCKQSSFQYYSKIIRKEICQNDLSRENFSFYTFRKTALSYMAASNIPVGNLAKITGHIKLETLFEYYYSDVNEFAKIKTKECVDNMNNLIKV